MNFVRQVTEKCAAATLAQNGETFTGTSQHANWLRQAAEKFRAAITLQIPVGHQDAAGFHYGEPRGYAPPPTDAEVIDTF